MKITKDQLYLPTSLSGEETQGPSGLQLKLTLFENLYIRFSLSLNLSEPIILLMHVHHFIELLFLQISDDHFRSCEFFQVREPDVQVLRGEHCLEGERRVLQTSKRHLVIRPSCGFPDLSPANVVWRHSSHIGGKVTMFVTVIGSVLCYDLSRRDLLVQLKQFVTDIKSS